MIGSTSQRYSPPSLSIRMIWVTLLLVTIAFNPADQAAAQNFSCGFADRGACLGYGETVCSSLGRCVDENAVCFDEFRCDYEGFTCRSNVTDCVGEYDELRRDYNQLVSEYNQLLEDFGELDDAFDEARRELRTQASAIGDLVGCLESAVSVTEAQNCIR